MQFLCFPGVKTPIYDFKIWFAQILLSPALMSLLSISMMMYLEYSNVTCAKVSRLCNFALHKIEFSWDLFMHVKCEVNIYLFTYGRYVLHCFIVDLFAFKLEAVRTCINGIIIVASYIALKSVTQWWSWHSNKIVYTTRYVKLHFEVWHPFPLYSTM